ncbi:MAG: sulfatase-like hydrolase/transferase [Bryobacteraceae bacterium]
MITRRETLGMMAGGLAPAVLRGGARRRPGDKPNLLFVWTDEQRADTLAAYGNHRYRMPVLNELASRSIVFGRCYDAQPVCTPARSSVMTGQWPHTTGCVTNNIPLPRQTQAMPELLNDSAYRTAYIGKWHLGDEVFAQHGFQDWISIEDIYTSYFSPGRDASTRSSYHQFLAQLGYKPDAKDGKFSRGFAVRRRLDHCKPAFMAGEASRLIMERRNEPWMLNINFLEPHMPFYGPLNDLHDEAEAPVPANYPGDAVEREPERYRRTRGNQLENGFEGQNLKTRAGWQRLNRNYAGLCTQVDLAVGQILNALEASGQADNTIVVFTSDHGEQMGSHSLYGKGVLYEESVNVPLLLHVPFRQSRKIWVEPPVSQIDLVPTLLELMGKKPPESLPGESLLSYVNGTARQEDHVFIEWHTPPNGPNARAVVSPDGWKLGLYDKDNCLLFHRDDDPLEMRNLYYRDGSAPVIRRLRQKIEAWQKRVGDKQALPA